jgi:hypothetical protein
LEKERLTVHCIFNPSDVLESFGVWNTKRAKSIDMPPFVEMTIECTRSPIAKVSTNLALVLHVQPMELVQPIWNRLTIPTARKQKSQTLAENK